MGAAWARHAMCESALRVRAPGFRSSKSKVHPCTGTEVLYRPYSPWGEERYSSNLSWATALEGVEWSASGPRPLFTPGKDHCTGGWLGPKAGLDRCEKSRPTGILSPYRPARSQSLCRLRYPAHFRSVRPWELRVKDFSLCWSVKTGPGVRRLCMLCVKWRCFVGKNDLRNKAQRLRINTFIILYAHIACKGKILNLLEFM
jgi:hypothetical protein